VYYNIILYCCDMISHVRGRAQYDAVPIRDIILSVLKAKFGKTTLHRHNIISNVIICKHVIILVSVIVYAPKQWCSGTYFGILIQTVLNINQYYLFPESFLSYIMLHTALEFGYGADRGGFFLQLQRILFLLFLIHFTGTVMRNT